MKAIASLAINLLTAAALMANPFFAFDNGLGKLPPTEQAALLKKLGYDGIGYTGTGNFAARHKAFEEQGLKIFNLYVHAFVDKPDAFEPGLKEIIPHLKGTGVDLWLPLRGKAPDDTAAVSLVREIADEAAAAGVRIALYPHKDFFVETAEEALRIVKLVDRPNVGLTINLCHELAAGNAERMDEIVKTCAPHLFYVSINGADHSGGWDKLIRPLDEGNFDLPAFLKSLGEIGYKGAVGLQCFQVPGVPEQHLERSFTKWKEIRKLIAVPENPPEKPNILFISIDDQNDWIGHLGGHPLVKTPAIDALAARGTTFLNAHCQAPICNPSRASALFGLRPTTTGIYGLQPAPRAHPELRDRLSLPQYFAAHGYRTYATGKIHHMGTRAGGDQPEFDVTGRYGGVGTFPPAKLVGETPMGNNKLIDWGVWPPDNEDTKKGDYQVATWIEQQIREAPTDQPFFIAAGFFLPHVPCYATQKWFDLYPDDDSVLPVILENDRDDVPRFAWYLNWHLSSPRLKWVRENNQWRNLVRSYLASTSFVDAQVGRLLKALAESGRDKDTIVVLWSDHGWHLGEKAITGKHTLWERSTRVPLVFAGRGITPGQRVSSPAELLDIFPTLIDLTGIPENPDLEGLSLVPQLRDATAKRERPAITSHNVGNHGIRSERWRYIRYADGTEELYDILADPREWQNLADKPEHAAIIAEHKKWLPQNESPPTPGSATRILSYDPATDIAVWDGKPITRKDPIPE